MLHASAKGHSSVSVNSGVTACAGSLRCNGAELTLLLLGGRRELQSAAHSAVVLGRAAYLTH